MTGEEMERAIAELITQQKAQIAQQTKIDNRIEFLVEQQANFQDGLMRLTGVVGKLAEQAAEDRQAVREAFNRFETDIGRLVDVVENSRDFTQQVARLAVASEND